MSLTFSTSPIPAAVNAPKNAKLELLVGRDYDSTGTLRTATYNGAQVLLDGVPLFAMPNVLELDLTFDQSDAVAVSYVLGTRVWLYWFDTTASMFVHTNINDGRDVRIDLDLNDRRAGSQIILAYWRAGLVYYRSQLDRYTIEYPVPFITASAALDVAGYGVNNRYVFEARDDNTGIPDSTQVGVAAVTIPPPPPSGESFLGVFKHLLPRARAWRITLDKTLRQFFLGLAGPCADIRAAAEQAFDNIFPGRMESEVIPDWEEQFALTADTGLTDAERRERLDARWKATGSLSPRHFEDVLRNSGFDVYVHEWWAPGTENPNGCTVPRDPNQYLNPTYSVTGIEDGGVNAEDGGVNAEDGAVGKGYLLTNVQASSAAAYLARCGQTNMRSGDPTARCNYFEDVIRTIEIPALPTDSTKYPYFVYVGGETFPDQASVPVARRAEFENLLLKYAPAHIWVGVLVTYV